MNQSEKKRIEIIKINDICKLVDNIDEKSADRISKEMNKYQPSLLAFISEYRIDLQTEQLAEIIQIIMLIWLFFKEKENVKKLKLSNQQYERLYKRNISLLKYIEVETEEKDREYAVKTDFNKVKSILLLAEIFHRFSNRSSLKILSNPKRGMILIELKSLIECFEEL